MYNWYKRKNNILGWMPKKIRSTREAKVWANMMAELEFKNIRELTYMMYLMNNIDLLKKDSPNSYKMLEYLEKIFNLTVLEDSTWEDRYFAILMYLRDKKEYTLRRLIDFIANVTDEKKISEVRTNFLNNDTVYTFNNSSTTSEYTDIAEFEFVIDDSTQHHFKNKDLNLSFLAIGNNLKTNETTEIKTSLIITYVDNTVQEVTINDFNSILSNETGNISYITIDDYISTVKANQIITDEYYHISDATIVKKTIFKDTLSKTFRLQDKKVFDMKLNIKAANIAGNLELSDFKLEISSEYTGYCRYLAHNEHYRIFTAEKFDVFVSIIKKEIIFRTTLDSVTKLKALKRSLEEIVPLNFTISIEAKLNTHGDLRVFAHRTLNSKTHEEVRKDDINTWQ